MVEVLIVIVVVGILASLAIPIYLRNVNSSRRVEAYRHIELIKGSLTRWYSVNGASYTGAALGGTLDYDPNNVLTQGGQTQNFNYTLAVPTDQTYVITATRNGNNAPGVTLNQTITMNEAGTLGGTYPL